MSCYRIKIRTGDGEDNYLTYLEPRDGEEPDYLFYDLVEESDTQGVLIRAYDALNDRDDVRKVTIEKYNDDCSQMLSETHLTKQ